MSNRPLKPDGTPWVAADVRPRTFDHPKVLVAHMYADLAAYCKAHPEEYHPVDLLLHMIETIAAFYPPRARDFIAGELQRTAQSIHESHCADCQQAAADAAEAQSGAQEAQGNPEPEPPLTTEGTGIEVERYQLVPGSGTKQ